MTFEHQHRRAEQDASSLLEPVIFSTAGLPVRDQFAAWHDQSARLIDVTEPIDPSAGFAASHEVWKLGPFALSHVVSPAARYQRTLAHIRRDSIDHWVICVARQGSHILRTGDAANEVPAGTPYIFSLDEAFAGERSSIDWLCLFVARDAFPELAVTIDSHRKMLLDNAMARLLGSYIGTLVDQLPTLTAAELPRAVEATRTMIAACVGACASGGRASHADVEHARMARIRQIIRQNLGSAAIGPNRICRLAGVSRSQLYRLFEPHGGVARYVQRERLRHAHRALSSPEDTRDINRIAEELGLFDASSFSRVFRREFDYSPTELRMIAQSGGIVAPIARGDMGPRASDFLGVLRCL
jgi:AraC-like DNA-binding protein